MWRRRLLRITAFTIVTPIALSSFGLYYAFPQLRSHPLQILSAHARMASVAGAGLSMARTYMFDSDSMHQKHIRASRALKKALVSCGGLYLKFGQIVGSLDIVIPDEYRTELRDLMTLCPEDTYEEVRRNVEKEIGMKLEDMFSEFDKKPVASASIAQVHRARLRTGEEVAVKVQHDGLIESTRFDIAVLSLFVDLGERMFEGFRYRWLVEEMSKNLPKELNFTLQKKNIEKIESLLKDSKLNCVVPKVYNPTTQRLLIMEFLKGVHIHELDKIDKMGVNRKKLATTVTKLLNRMIFVYGFLHADPHSGNLMVRKKKGTKDQGQVILLDHGLYQILSEDIKKNYCRFWLGVLTQNQPLIFDAAQRLGTHNPRLFCAMVTFRKYQTIHTKGKYNKLVVKDQQLDELQSLAKENFFNITSILNEMNRELLLLFKVNDFSRALEKMLAGRDTRVYLEIAKCCFQTLQVSWWRRWLFIIGFYLHEG